MENGITFWKRALILRKMFLLHGEILALLSLNTKYVNNATFFSFFI